MIITLMPPDGVLPLVLGMTVDEAERAMSAWGQPERVRTDDGSPPELRVKDAELTRDVFAYFEDGERLTAVEVWRPYGPDNQVVWDGIDIFGLSDEEVLAQVEARGVTIDLSDPFHPTCPELTLGFNRERMTGHFESVLVAKPGYYPTEPPEIELPPFDPHFQAG